MLHTFHRTIITPLLDFIYPPLCIICKKYLETNETTICPLCWSGITAVDPAHPVWQELEGKFTTEGVVQEFLSCYLFEKEGTLQHLIHALKYEGMKSVGVLLGKEIGNRIQSCPDLLKADYLIPIPLHSLKKRERGYNQSEYICRGISETSGIPIQASLLLRKRYTQSQTQLNMQERRENVSDAFTIPDKLKSSVKGKSFILVDDVITTGATINACAHILKDNGASSVFAASVALAQ